MRRLSHRGVGTICGRARRAPALAALAVAALLAGCAGQDAPGTEQMLGAAGFRPEPATTPAVRNELSLLPSYRLMQRSAGAGGAVEYVYADPGYCRCLYVGGPAQFQAYQRLAFEQRLAAERLEAARAQWGPWGSPFWGPEVIVVHGGHDHDHDHDHR